MTTASDTHTSNLVIGAGRFFLDELDASGDPTGERYIGDTVSASIAVSEETSTIVSGDGAVPQNLVESATSREQRMTVTMRDMSAANLALIISGTVDVQADSADAVTDEPLSNLKQGHWYQLGVSAANPSGIGAIAKAGLAVSDKSDTAHALGDDYMADHENGRIYIVPGGGIAAGSAVKVDYTPVAAKYDRVKSSDGAAPEYALRYIEDASAGRGRNIFIRRARVTASGELAVKGDRNAVQQPTIAVQALKPSGGTPAITIDGVQV